MIDLNKKYRYCGYECRIVSIEKYPDMDDRVVFGFFKHNDKWIGFFNDESSDEFEDVSPYENFKIDDKVIVWDTTDFVSKRHFAGVNYDGRPLAFNDGLTSWTGSKTTKWNFCEKAEEE